MEALAAILGAGLPLLGQLVELASLFITAQKESLTAEEVQAEIDKILARRTSQDAEENKAAGID